MATIDDKEPAVLADLDAVHGVELVRPRLVRILRRAAPVHQELAVLVELGDARAAVTVADEERAVGQPVDVGGPIEELAGIATSLALGAERHHQLAVIGEFVDDVQLVVEHPDVLFGIVRTHLDLVWSAPAGHLEEFVVLWPRLDHLAGAIHREDDVVIAPLPAALLRCGFARGAQPVVIARGACRATG